MPVLQLPLSVMQQFSLFQRIGFSFLNKEVIWSSSFLITQSFCLQRSAVFCKNLWWSDLTVLSLNTEQTMQAISTKSPEDSVEIAKTKRCVIAVHRVDKNVNKNKSLNPFKKMWSNVTKFIFYLLYILSAQHLGW